MGFARQMVIRARQAEGLPLTMVARQADGHSEVVLKNMPCPEGSVVAMVPNGQLLTFIAEHGGYSKVCWGRTEGYARRGNMVLAKPPHAPTHVMPATRRLMAKKFEFTDAEVDIITLSRDGDAVNVHGSSGGNVGIWEGFDSKHTRGRKGLLACLQKWGCPKKWSVFACHSKKRPYTPGLVRMVKSHLKARGYSTFFDTDALVSICKEELEAAIANSSIFVLFLDDKTLDSEWCEFEVSAAVKHKVPIHVVVDVDHHGVEDLIDYWRNGRKKGTTRYLFGAYSHQLIAHSVKHEALHDDAMLKIEQRIYMALNE